jgi:gas vesicle protein
MSKGSYESADSNVGTAITFLLIGLGAGALAGLLLAPKTGKQLRRDLKRGYDDARDTVEDWAEEAKDRVRDASDRVREVTDRVKDAASRGAEIAEDLRDTVREKAEPLRRVINRG